MSFDTVTTTLNYLVVNFPEGITLFITLIVSPVMALVIKWLEVQSNFVKWLIVTTASFVAMVVNYILTASTADPSIIVAQTALLQLFNEPYYRAIIKPVGRSFSSKIIQAKALSLEAKKAALIPSTPTPVADPFSE